MVQITYKVSRGVKLIFIYNKRTKIVKNFFKVLNTVRIHVYYLGRRVLVFTGKYPRIISGKFLVNHRTTLFHFFP